MSYTDANLNNGENMLIKNSKYILDFDSWNDLYDFIYQPKLGRVDLMLHIRKLRYQAKEKVRTFKFKEKL